MGAEQTGDLEHLGDDGLLLGLVVGAGLHEQLVGLHELLGPKADRVGRHLHHRVLPHLATHVALRLQRYTVTHPHTHSHLHPRWGTVGAFGANGPGSVRMDFRAYIAWLKWLHSVN